METVDLTDALSFANYQGTVNQQRILLKQKFDSDCIITHNGGLFRITQEWLGGFDQTSEWVLDMNSRPVKIENPEEFYHEAKDTYKKALSEYGTEFQNLRARRNVSSLVGL